MNNFNNRVAIAVTNVTGNMWFFWAALMFCLLLTILYPPSMNTLLLNISNDLQLLLLAANAVVGGKQILMLQRLLNEIKVDEETEIKEEEETQIELTKLIAIEEAEMKQLANEADIKESLDNIEEKLS